MKLASYSVVKKTIENKHKHKKTYRHCYEKNLNNHNVCSPAYQNCYYYYFLKYAIVLAVHQVKVVSDF